MKEMYVPDERIPYFSDDGLSCAESTLRYLIEQGIAETSLDSVKMMTGMHGNMGRCANCGAINGGAAAIGSVLGRTDPHVSGKPVYDAVEEFQKLFEEKFGSTKCEQLTAGRDLASHEQQDLCAGYVYAATQMVKQVLKKYK